MGVGVLGSEEGTKSVRYVKQILTRRLRSRLPKGLSELNYYIFSSSRMITKIEETIHSAINFVV